MNYKNLKKKARKPQASRLFPNVCNFQKYNHTPGYRFKNLQIIYSLAYGFLFFVISLDSGYGSLSCKGENKKQIDFYILKIYLEGQRFLRVFGRRESVLRIHDILVWIRIRIRGSLPVNSGSGCGSGSGSFYFHHCPSRCQQKTN